MNKKPELLPSCRLNLPGGKKRILLVLLVMMLSVVTSFAQSVNVKGRVIDKNGDPVIGATVVEVGSKGNGTVTDIDGNYSITLKSRSSQVSFSAIGYETMKVGVKGRTVIDVEMRDDVYMIDELVVVGYGKMRKSDLTGSVATVTTKDFNKGLVSSAEQLINGKVSGVQIMSNSGSASAGSTIRVRGGASLNASNDPSSCSTVCPWSAAVSRATTTTSSA